MKTQRRKRGAFSLPAIRRGEIERHALHVGAADTEDFWRWLVAWCWHNDRNVRDRTGALQFAAERMGGSINEPEAEATLERAEAIRQHRTADKLAKFLGVTDRQRTALGITSIGSIDVGRKQREKRRREHKRMNKELIRRARGIKPRAQYESSSLSRTRPWDSEGISRRTWYRRRGTSVSPPIPPLESGGTTGRSTSPGPAIFLSAVPTPVPPVRKKGDFRGGACVCGICGNPGANVAYFASGMTEVVYRHHECDRRGAPRELSPSEERQAWSIDQLLSSE